MLSPEKPPGRVRRALSYFGLVEPIEEHRQDADSRRQRELNPRSQNQRRAQKTLAYFGLAAGPDASRYATNGEHVDATLDADIDELRARVAELEARLEALTAQR